MVNLWGDVGRRSAAIAALALLLLAAGCASMRTFQNDLPRHVARYPGWEIRSDVKLSRTSGLEEELNALRSRVSSTLDLPPPDRDVVVYLFKDEERYTNYMTRQFPDLPQRRAFFIGSPGELAVYAFYGDRTGEDLRHECTHGILHATVGDVPLWLDEGLAEYFEVDPDDPSRINKEHAQRLAIAIQNGWEPDLDRLSQLEEVAEMQRADYQEAWAWVHFLLHESPTGRDILLETLHGLRNRAQQPPLAEMVRERMPSASTRMTSYVTGVVGPSAWASGDKMHVRF